MDAFIFLIFAVAYIVFSVKKYSDLVDFVRENYPEELENISLLRMGVWGYLMRGSNIYVKEKVEQLATNIFLFFWAGLVIIFLLANFTHVLKD